MWIWAIVRTTTERDFFTADTEIVKIEKWCSTIITQKSRKAKNIVSSWHNLHDTYSKEIFFRRNKGNLRLHQHRERAELEKLWSSFFSRLSSTLQKQCEKDEKILFLIVPKCVPCHIVRKTSAFDAESSVNRNINSTVQILNISPKASGWRSTQKA